MDLSPSLIIVIAGQAATMVGIYYTYQRNRRLFSFQKTAGAALERIQRQLTEFYGPLNILMKRNGALYAMFAAMQQRDPMAARSILVNGLLPTNAAMVELIIRHSDLIDQHDNLQYYGDFMAHVDALQLESSAGTLSRTLLPFHVPFPATFPSHVSRMYERIRERYLGMLEAQ